MSLGPKASGSGSCLPKYPGFENDVFAVVRDYFVNIGIPLIPNQLYALVIHIYDIFSTQDTPQPIYQNLRQNTMKNNTPLLSTADKLKRQLSSEKPMKTSTPILESQTLNTKTTATTVELPPNHVFETVFMGDKPVTKIVSIDELTNLFRGHPRLKRANSFHRNCSSNKNQILENKRTEGNTQYIEAIATIPRSLRRHPIPNSLKSPIVDNIYKSQYESPDSSTSSDRSGGYHNFGFAMQSPGEDGEYMLCKSVSSLSSIGISPNPRHDSKDNLSAQFSKSSNNSHNLNTFVNKSEEKLLKVLQMSLFLMPSPNRRHLHLLLRLLSKIIENKEIKFNLSEGTDLKTYVKIFI